MKQAFLKTFSCFLPDTIKKAAEEKAVRAKEDEEKAQKEEKQSKRMINWRPKTNNYTEKKKTYTMF